MSIDIDIEDIEITEKKDKSESDVLNQRNSIKENKEDMNGLLKEFELIPK